MNDSSIDFYAISGSVFQRICIVAALYAACFDYGRDPQGPVPATLSNSMKQICTEMFGMSLGDDQRSLTFRLLFAQVYQSVWPYFSFTEHPLATLRVVLQRVGRDQAQVTVANFVNQYLAEGSLLTWINLQDSPKTSEALGLRYVRQIAAAAAVYAVWADYPQLVEQREKIEQYAELLLLLSRKKAFPHLAQILKQEHTSIFCNHFSYLYERLTKQLQANHDLRMLFDRIAGVDKVKERQEVVQRVLDWLGLSAAKCMALFAIRVLCRL